jgi:hypothetical protein
MDWQNIITLVGMLIGGSGLYGWYKARPEKISFEIKNLREVIEVLKKEKEEDKLEAAQERQKLGRRLGEIEITNSVLQKAIQQWVKCSHLPKDAVCPVSDFVDRAEELIIKKVEALHQSMKENNKE